MANLPTLAIREVFAIHSVWLYNEGVDLPKPPAASLDILATEKQKPAGEAGGETRDGASNWTTLPVNSVSQVGYKTQAVCSLSW